MPTIVSHAFVAVAASPWARRAGCSVGTLLLAAACCALPDVDVIGFRFGVPYGSMFGHRGFTHSIVFAGLAGALVAGLAASRRAAPQRFLPLFVLFAGCILSHPLLDMLTDGGKGVALWAPFSNARYFFPLRPIHVSPIGLSRFISGTASATIRSELQWVVLPCLLLAAAGSLVLRLPAQRPNAAA